MAVVGPMMGGPGRGRPAPTQPAQDRALVDRMTWQFPWYWSAAVLVGLFGLSACILNFRIKSLDRLR